MHMNVKCLIRDGRQGQLYTGKLFIFKATQSQKMAYTMESSIDWNRLNMHRVLSIGAFPALHLSR